MISRIYISNYKSISELEIFPENLCALIAPNSTGKTNVFKALNILLGETYPTEKAFSKEDFHKRNTKHPIIIRVDLSKPLGAVYATKKSSSGKGNCEAIALQLEYRITEHGGSSYFTCFGTDGEEYYGNGQIRDQLSWVYIPSERSFEKQLSMSKWTLFGKILSKVDVNFRANKERVDAFEKSMNEPKSILEKDFDEGISYAKFKNVFVSKVEQNILGHSNGCDLNLEIYDPLWYYKMIQITTMERDQRFNVEEIGSGTQNLILLSLFQTFASLMKSNAILAIEEPELYLFPHAQRQLYKEFRKLSEHTQIFYTTHSPNFVDISNCNEAIILRKEDGETIKLNTGKLSDFIDEGAKHELHLQTKFNSSVNEIFFADKIILVEGDTEKSTLPHILEKIGGSEVEAINYLILNCSSKDFIPFYIRVCKFLGLENFIAVYDTDLHDGKNEQQINTAKKSTEGIYEALEGDISKCVELHPDFETLCGYSTADKNKIREAVSWVGKTDADKMPKDFLKILEFLLPPKVEVAEAIKAE
jgi:putative ATP-dependent endonuclease of OLD family